MQTKRTRRPGGLGRGLSGSLAGVLGGLGLSLAAVSAVLASAPPPLQGLGGQDQVSGHQEEPIAPSLDRSVTQRPLSDSFTPPVMTDSAAADVQFPLKTIKVQGVSVLPRDKVEAVIAPYRGRTVSLAELQKAANAITRLYAQAGYGLSFAVIPEQDVKDGVVRIVAIEVYIDRITVQLNQSVASLVGRRRIEELLSNRANALRKEFPVKVGDIESMLLSINDLPGIRVAATIRRGVRGQGAAQMILSITSTGASLEVDADNRLKSAFGRYEYSVTAKLRSVAFVGDEIGATAVRSIVPRDFDFWSAFYQTPILGSNTQAFVTYSNTSNLASSGELAALGNAGTEENLSFGVIQPLIRTRSQSVTLKADLGAIDATSKFEKRTGLLQSDQNPRRRSGLRRGRPFRRRRPGRRDP
jgi:hemolysin activation/secretion protein